MQEEQDYYSMRMESILEDLEPEIPDEDDDAAALQEPDIQALETDLYQADQRQAELTHIQEMLVETNGVSRAMAENFKDVLPAEMAIESFTSQITSTNHKMSLEFISTAIKLVAVAGVLAVLGGVGYLVWKLVKFKKRLPNNKMDKQITAMFSSVEDKLRSAISELRHLFPDVEHQDLTWKREEGLVNAAITSRIHEIDVEMLTGQYKSLSALAGADCMRQAQSIDEFFVKAIIPELEKVMKAGSGKDVQAISDKVEGFKVEDLVGQHLDRFGKDKHLRFNTPAEVCPAFRTKYSAPIPANEIPSRLGNLSASATTMDEKVISTMFTAQDIMTVIGGKIQGYEKRLDKNKELPSEYVADLRALLEKCRVPLNSLADVFTIVELEVESHKRSSKIKAMAVSNGFKAVSEFYQEQAKTNKEKAKDYKSCVQHLKKLFDPIASALKS